MSGATLAWILGQACALTGAPLLPGGVQLVKARLQGRRGAGLLQPYRELRRLWGKNTVLPQGTTVLYRWAPAVVTTCVASCVLVLPIAGLENGSPLAHDALLLVGLFALSRFVLAVSAWDTGAGFGLMGASRDLVLSVFGDGLLFLVMIIAALSAQSTDLHTMSVATSGWTVWGAPAHWCASIGFALVLLLETGRQPIDNPDTHLELTMIHEGPLLEYAGRDLAYLQWSSAARHYLMFALAAELFLPHGGSFLVGVALMLVWLVVLCPVVALMETAVPKVRTVQVPSYLGAGIAIVFIGFASWLVGAHP